jgi:hypothetical protein
VHLGRETLFNGENEYLIEATFADGSILTRKVSLVVAYERIVIDDTILYLDANFIPKGAKEDILRKADDFAGSSANFITHGCDPDNPQPDVLIQRAYQYSTVPACMTFSLDNNYLLWFNFKERGLDSYFYDIMSPVEGVVYKKFPLFTYDLHTPYMSLVFFDVRT